MARVFVSHRGADSVEAERLADVLRRAGHDVWLDLWALRIGDSIVEGMERGLANADYVIVCYSSAGVNAPWMTREWASTLARQLSGVGVRLLPVRLTGSGAPALLQDIKYADLVADWNAGVRELLGAIVSR